MALRKPGELFNKDGEPEKESSTDVSENIDEIKQEFTQYSWNHNKIEELRRQVDNVSSSLNYGLSEVVDKNLNFLNNEYTKLVEKFNDKIKILDEQFTSKVDELKKSHVSLNTEVTIIEKRQKNLKLVEGGKINVLKEEVLSELEGILSGNVTENFKKLEEKVDTITKTQIQNLTESYNEPPDVNNSDVLTPLNKKFVNLDEFQEHYRVFLNRIQRQLSSLGGGGAVLITDLDDVERSTAQVNGKYLRYNSTKGKWEGADASGGGGGGGISNVVEDTSPQLGGNLDVNGKDIVSTSNGNIEFSPNGTGAVVFKGVNSNGGNGAGRFKLNCEVNTHGITIQGPPHSAGANYTLTLPNTDGNADQVLKTNGSGVLDWVNQSTNQNAFSNIAVSGQSTVAADSETDTLTLVAGSNMQITTNASGDSITFASTGGGGGSQNVFSTIAVSGQNNIVADSTTDTLTLVAGSNMTITTNDSSDTITFASTGGSTLTTEQVQDIVGAMFSGNTETNITATYQDSDGTIDLVASGGVTSQSTTFTGSAGTAQVIETYAVGSADCTEFTFHVTSGVNIQAQKLLVMDNGSAVHFNQYAVMYSGNKLIDFSADLSGGNVRIKATPETGVSGSITIKSIKQVI